MAGKTAQRPSQYRHELQTVIRRSASASALVACISSCFRSSDFSEHTADRHTDAGCVTLTKDVARHDFTRTEHVRGWLSIAHHQAGFPIHSGSEVSEGNAWTNRISVKWRLIDRPCPMALLRRQALGPAVVQYGVIECAGLHRGIEVRDRS